MAVEVATPLLVTFNPDPKAIHAQIKVRADSALYPHNVADVPLAVVTMVLRSAHRIEPQREQRPKFQVSLLGLRFQVSLLGLRVVNLTDLITSN
jgi:hypothetical protein